MKKIVFGVLVTLVGMGVLGMILLDIEAVQDTLTLRAADSLLSVDYESTHLEDSLNVFVCGSSSPIPDPDRAQACIAIITPNHFFIIDSGAGSTSNLLQARLPMNRLQSILLTHFHSDHIAEIYEVNLNSWVAGRPAPLNVYGPAGIEDVVEGINSTYKLDVGYRVAHHGAELLPPHLGVLSAEEVAMGQIFEGDGLTITSFKVDHEPVSPAIGYKINYKGRTVVVTGDTVVTDGLAGMSLDSDLLLTDALSLPLLEILSEAATAAGMSRNSKILMDVTDYHAQISNVESMISKAVSYTHLTLPTIYSV